MRRIILPLFALFFILSVPLAWAAPLLTLSGGSGNTYSASTALFTPPASAYDIVTITAPTNRTLKVFRIQFSMTQTTASNVPVYLTYRSAADTNPVSGATAVTPTPLDPNNPTAGAVVYNFTTVPTAYGTAVGTLSINEVMVPATTTIASPAATTTLFDASPVSQPIVLRNGDTLAINLNGTTPSGAANATATIWYQEVNSLE